MPDYKVQDATDIQDGHYVRPEPAVKNPEGGVVIRASELMGRDIGRFIKFIERFGHERESVRVVIGELRQLYAVGDGGDEIVVSIGTGANDEYRFQGSDRVAIYGDQVSKAPIDDVTGYKILDNHPE